MIDQGFTRTIAIIVGELLTCIDIFLGNENQMRTIFVGYNFSGEITVAWVIDQTSQFASFGCCVDAAMELMKCRWLVSFQRKCRWRSSLTTIAVPYAWSSTCSIQPMNSWHKFLRADRLRFVQSNRQCIPPQIHLVQMVDRRKCPDPFLWTLSQPGRLLTAFRWQFQCDANTLVRRLFSFFECFVAPESSRSIVLVLKLVLAIVLMQCTPLTPVPIWSFSHPIHFRWCFLFWSYSRMHFDRYHRRWW